MAEITAGMVKELREKTDAPMMECKKALTEADGDLAKAEEILRVKLGSKAGKAASRVTAEGIVGVWLAPDAKTAAMVELNCETDFVALNESFKQLARDIAMHIVAAQPEYVRREEVPADAFEREKQVQVEKTMSEGKPQAIAEKIVVGRMSKWYEEVCLLDQKWFKDDSKTVDQVVKDLTAVIGENVQVRRFSRFVMGEGLTRRSDDFAAEVAKQAGIA